MVVARRTSLGPALREKGIDMLTVVNTPIERARLYFRYRPLLSLLAAADHERVSHRAFGLPNLKFTQGESDWPRKVAMNQMMSMKINLTCELLEPLDPVAALTAPNKMDGYEITDADQRMLATGMGQLVGEFLLDRDGIIHWSFTEVPDGAKNRFGAPTPQEVPSAASRVAN